MNPRASLRAAVAVGLVGVFAAACGSSRRAPPIGSPFAPESPLVARGEMAFMRHCHACHTQGEASFAPALNNKPVPGWLIKWQVRAGFGAMPSFSKREISPEELDAIVGYLKALRRHR
jgi:mono/diheme cytochrome c family protein